MDPSPLRISSLPPGESPGISGDCKIPDVQQLPDEILLRIFSDALPQEPWERNVLLSCVLVCRKWRNLSETVLFRDIRFGKVGSPISRSYSERKNFADLKTGEKLPKLLAVLEQNALLRPYVRSFQIQFPLEKMCPLILNDAIRLLKLCRAIRKISLGGNIRLSYIRDENLVGAIRSLPFLEELTLSGMMGAPEPTLPDLNLPTLKRLVLHQYGWARRGADWEAPGPDGSPVSSVEQYRKWNISNLTISAPRSSFDVTKHYVQLPRRLESISVQDLCRQTSASQVQELLDIHSESLVRISIGSVNPKPEVDKLVPNLSHFYCLQNLTMRAFDVLVVIPSVVLQNLSAPNLQTLTLSYIIETRGRPVVSDYWGAESRFQPRHVSWFEEFLARKKLLYPKSKLEAIFLDYAVDRDHLHSNIFESPLPWPWAEVERACGLVNSACGEMLLDYKEPWITQAEWDRKMRNRCLKKADQGNLQRDHDILKAFKKTRRGLKGTLEYESEGSN